MSNVLPFSMKLHTQPEPGRDSRYLGLLRISSDGRVRAEASEADILPYLTDMAEKLNRRVVAIAMMGPDATGRFDSWNRVVEHDDPEFPEALKLRLEGEYGLIAEEAA